MTANTPALPRVVSREEWVAARKALLTKEKQLTRARDALSAERRRLSMVEIEKDYAFEGPAGPGRLLDLFEGRRQLIIYHRWCVAPRLGSSLDPRPSTLNKATIPPPPVSHT